MQEAEPAGAPVRVDAPDTADLRTALRWMCLAIGVASLVVMVLDLLLAPPGRSETGVAALMAAVAWTCWAALYLRRVMPELIAVLIVLGVLATATYSVISFGSVRTAVNFLFVGAVVGAGTFLGKRIMLAVLFSTVLLLGLLTWIESTQGFGVETDFQVGLRVWITQATALAVVGLMVMHSRGVNHRALLRLRDELERRRQTEQERDRSLARFARIFRTSPSPMIAQSARTGSILDVNPAFERCYGYHRNQVLGRQDTFLWDDALERERYVDRLAQERHIDQYRGRGRRSNGQAFEAMISSEMGSEDEDRLIITTVTDMSGRDDLLEKLRRSEALFAKAFNFSPLNLAITRLADGTFLEVNRAEDRVQGMTPDELKGRTSLEVGAWLSSDDRARFVERLQREGRVEAFDTKMRHKDDRLVDARLWAEVIDVDGEPCILSSTLNISEEKRREALLMEVAKGVAGETGEAFFSALAEHLSGASKADFVVVAEVRDEHTLDTLAVWRDGRLTRSFNFGVAGTPCADTLRQDDLMVCTVNLADTYPLAPQLRAQGYSSYLGQALRDADGQAIGLLLAMWRAPVDVDQDIQALISIFASRARAELVRLRRDREIVRLNETLEQRVRERTEELQKLNAELDAFAYSVSHDLKSPLRAIDGFTQLLKEQLDGRLDPDSQQLFERVLSSSQRMGSIINDLLGLARISQGVLQRSEIDLSQQARAVFEQERSRAPERRMQMDIEPGLIADCDPDLARIVLENLIGNAVKYSRQREEARITLTSDGLDESGALRLRLSDNGTGFDMAYVDKLFKPFQRLHRPSEFEGTGIGLATVRRIVERHGGTLSAEGRPGEGAVFRFSFGLPVRD